MIKKPKNQAGVMGAKAAQPAKLNSMLTVDPLERLNQKMSGRTQGGVNKKERRSLLNSIGVM